MTDHEHRSVAIRLHRGMVTMIPNMTITLGPRGSWPTEVPLPLAPSRVRLQVSRHRWQSLVTINHDVAWEFTWRETTDWTIEEFLYEGEIWRLEYQTRWPVFDPESGV